MIVVMQCAKTKQAHAGRMRTSAGRPVGFVARPELAPAMEADLLYVRPDDICDSKTGQTWREQLADYNADYQTACVRRGAHAADNETQPWNDPEVNADLPYVLGLIRQSLERQLGSEVAE